MASCRTPEGHVTPVNPALSVKGPRYSIRKGLTPVGLRDRALIALLTYKFARVSAAVNMKVEELDSAKAVRSLVEEYSDSPDVAFHFVDNRSGEPRLVGNFDVTEAGQDEYTGIGERLHRIAAEEHSAGRITDAVCRSVTGRDPQEAQPGSRPTDGGQPPAARPEKPPQVKRGRYQKGRCRRVRLFEKNGTVVDVACHHDLEEYLFAYINAEAV